ncbi:kinase-like domain-containing protein [Mycena epipterygia]|nr:kinase-like domain-containing protein [Mycena epipterygia]
MSAGSRALQLPCIPDDWDSLPSSVAKEVWFSCSPLLRQYGIIIFGDADYLRAPYPPRLTPRNAFHPEDQEDFIHRVSKSPRRILQFSFYTPTSYIGLDDRGRNVFIKAVKASLDEWRTIQYLSTTKHPWNRTVPRVSLITADKWVFIVQAYWGSLWDRPPWDSVSTRLRMARQLIEGLCFMHMHGVAHGDLHPGNIVCNHEDIQPPHTIWASGTAQPAFQSTFDYQLAFIDFECAVRFPLDAQSHTIKCESAPPIPFAPPECKADIEYDMFAADVYSI